MEKCKMKRYGGISIVCIVLFVHSFLLTIGVPANTEIVIQIVLISIGILSRNKVVISNEIFLWLLPSMVLLVYNQEWIFDAAMKYIVWYVVGWLVLLIPLGRERNYSSLKSINWMSCLIFISVLIQRLFPRLWLGMESHFANRDYFVTMMESRSGIFYGIAVDKSCSLLISLVGVGVLWYFSSLYKNSNVKRIIFVLINIYVMFYAGSRSLLLVIPMTIAIVEVISTNDKHKISVILRLISIALVGILCVMLIYSFAPNITAIRRLVNSVILYQAGGDISSGRSKLYAVAIEGIKRNGLLTGSGWYSFNKYNVGIIDDGTASFVHNILLQLLYDTGLFGTIIFLTPFMYTLYQTIYFIKHNERGGSSAILFSLYLQIVLLLESFLHVGVLSSMLMQVYFIAVLLSIGCRKGIFT